MVLCVSRVLASRCISFFSLSTTMAFVDRHEFWVVLHCLAIYSTVCLKENTLNGLGHLWPSGRSKPTRRAEEKVPGH
ncbi:hypothetical protein EJ02DRAFT_248691 [Clathrospora elynae]|uniref:Uncharacterized protein n=1 Tax=Clathrospora elynae TaxID=706981 RepID=A0A6A5T2Z0_9PLEO|nr:hypothetical protein EJ02DRAFT_248691 [Clathrospora elynae]